MVTEYDRKTAPGSSTGQVSVGLFAVLFFTKPFPQGTVFLCFTILAIFIIFIIFIAQFPRVRFCLRLC